MSVNNYTASTGTLTPLGGVPYETINSLSSNIADDFDTTKAYSEGEIVKYTDNLTYKCIADTTAGTLPTNITYWERTSLGKAISKVADYIPSVGIASASRAGIVKAGQGLSITSDGTLSADVKVGSLIDISKTEGTTTATKAHSEGDYFDLGGVFVKATDDISIGDTLTEGTNYKVTNIGSELSALSGLDDRITALESESELGKYYLINGQTLTNCSSTYNFYTNFNDEYICLEMFTNATTKTAIFSLLNPSKSYSKITYSVYVRANGLSSSSPVAYPELKYGNTSLFSKSYTGSQGAIKLSGTKTITNYENTLTLTARTTKADSTNMFIFGIGTVYYHD